MLSLRASGRRAPCISKYSSEVYFGSTKPNTIPPAGTSPHPKGRPRQDELTHLDLGIIQVIFGGEGDIELYELGVPFKEAFWGKVGPYWRYHIWTTQYSPLDCRNPGCLEPASVKENKHRFYSMRMAAA